MLDQQTVQLIIGVLFLFVAYALQDKQYEQYLTHAFVAIGALVLFQTGLGKKSGCL